jgi:hypothetical protein
MINSMFISSATTGGYVSAISQEASRASRQASTANDEIKFVKADVEKLLMITEALWTLLKDQHGYSDEDLVKQVEEIDLRDGRLDGKVASAPRKCPSCNRAISRKRSACLYCGQEVKADLFER